MDFHEAMRRLSQGLTCRRKKWRSWWSIRFDAAGRLRWYEDGAESQEYFVTKDDVDADDWDAGHYLARKREKIARQLLENSGFDKQTASIEWDDYSDTRGPWRGGLHRDSENEAIDKLIRHRIEEYVRKYAQVAERGLHEVA